MKMKSTFRCDGFIDGKAGKSACPPTFAAVITGEYMDGFRKGRLESIRENIKAESVSYGELVELESLADYIDNDDLELMQWANVPEKVA